MTGDPRTAPASRTAELLAEQIGVRLGEDFQLRPEQSNAIVVHHPEMSYFQAR
ncbi:hypothetical protein ACFY94_15085 [Streptomyces griseorubiginosus]|uniref:hypothetical protein n=1 Tax=Streptomyces griseorubiginosus TaxID=67304 RepID=UPI0036EF4919